MRARHIQRMIVALLAWLVVAPVGAQTTGDIYGTVTDEAGQPLPGATVTISGVGAPQSFVTVDGGRYRFLHLDPGHYSLVATLEGYSRIEWPDAVVALNRNTTIDFTLTSAFGEVLQVTGEGPLMDERETTRGTVVPAVELEAIPTARDPWEFLPQVPGVLVDRINVGGSASGQQPGFILAEAEFADNDYLIDGVQITDAVQPGVSTTYFDFEQFESIDFSTGGPDVTKNTPGVGINLVTRRGTNEFRGTARFLSTRHDGLGFLGGSSSSFSCSELPPTQDCDDFQVGRVDKIDEYGFQAGGPALLDRLWLWGSYGVSQIANRYLGGDVGVINLENVAIKLNGQLSSRNNFVASWNNGDKRVAGRFAGPTRAPETTQDQRSPTAFWRFEDTHVFGSNLFVTGAYQKIDGGFQLKPRSGCLDASCPPEQEILWDSDGVWRQNWYNGFSRRPEDAFRMDGSYFFDTGAMSHELKFGGRYRGAGGFTNFNSPGRDIVHVAGENFNQSDPISFFVLERYSKSAPVEADFTSLWVQDTLATGRWTVNLGVRYDLQRGTNKPGTTGESVFPDIFPELVLETSRDAGFEWESITPRIGATLAVGEDRDTLLRASFAQFPGALGVQDVNWTSPLRGSSYAYFLFIDEEGDNIWHGNEPYFFIGGANYDEKNPTTNWNTVDPGLDPQITSETVLGVEHSPLPELVVGLAYTRRKVEDVLEDWPYVRPSGTSGAGFLATADDYVFDSLVTATLPDGTTSTEPIYMLDPSLELMGFRHWQNGSRSRQYNGLALSVNKRLANRWSLRGLAHWGEAEWSVPEEFLARDDPTDSPGTGDNDGGLYVVGAGGPRVDAFMQSTWQWSLVGIYQVAPDRPWGFNLSANLEGREGYVLPYLSRNLTSDFSSRVSVSHVGGAADRFRLDDVTVIDLRAEKTFGLSGKVNLTLGLDLFNALNDATVFARNVTLGPTENWVQDVVKPRIWRLGVRVSWR